MSRVRMNSSFLASAALGAALFIASSAAPASAQLFGFPGWRGEDNAMPPAVVYQRLMARGLRPIGSVVRNGGVYLLDVLERSGRRRRLVIDAYSGAVLQAFAYGPPRPVGQIPQGPRYAPGPSYASRYPPGAQDGYGSGDPAAPQEQGVAPPAPQGLGFGQAPNPGYGAAPPTERHSREAKPKRPARKVARREVAPAHQHAQPQGSPSQAKLEPSNPASSPASTNGGASSSPTTSHAASKSDGAVSASSAAPAAAAPASAPASAPTPSPNKAGKGYAHGVPINPLD